MLKPQEKYSKVFAKDRYPDIVHYYYDMIVERMSEIQREDVQLLVDEVYKDAYVDGFKDALYFSNRYE